MRILLLSRPVVNAGDFLFSEKSLEAFAQILPETTVVTGHISTDMNLEEINGFNAIVAAGGPLYDNRFLTEESFPTLKYMDRMIPKLHFLSNGWYGKDAEKDSLNNYKFEDNVMDNLKLIQERGGTFSCRDYISKYILKNNGIENVTMAGCTAWYDYDRMGVLEPLYSGKIRKIFISDQGITKEKNRWSWKYVQMENMIEMLQHLFPDAKLLFSFNGGIYTKYSKEYNLKICELLKRNHIAYYDISGSKKGFSLYDKADLHIGFRMHSHIYCMSKRIPSVLISEDARGIGLNTSTGLNDIRDFTVEKGSIVPNKNMVKELEYYLDDLDECQYKLLTSAYIRMNTIYQHNFVPFLRRICSND